VAVPVACPIRQLTVGTGSHSRIPHMPADLRTDRSGRGRSRPPKQQVILQRRVSAERC